MPTECLFGKSVFSPCYCDLSFSRISFHSAKQPQHVPHLFKNASLDKVPSSSSTNPTRSSPDSRLYPCLASNCGPIQSRKTTESATGFADGCNGPTMKKKKKKKKQRNSEMEIPTAEPAAKTEQHMPEAKKVKKRKKRKREEEQSSVKVQREGMQSHLDPSGQDEDWCLGESWTINPDGSTERPNQQPQLRPEPNLSQPQEQIQAVFCETAQNHPIVKKKKKKKKHKERQDENIMHETFKRLVVFINFITVVLNSLTNIIHF